MASALPRNVYVARVTLTRAAVLLHGLSTTDFPHAADLPPKTKAALEPLLRAQGFDPRRAIHVEQLPDDQGFRLTQ